MATPDHGAMRPMWHCPECGKPFANRNSSHSCVRIPLDSHFEGRPRARQLFDALLAAVNETGDEPVSVVASKGRIELMTRARFVAVTVRPDHLRGHVWLKHRHESDRFHAELLPPNNWIHRFELRDEVELDDEFRTLLSAGREIGDQIHPSQTRYRLNPIDRPPAG
jgi:hypothetical protein